MSISVMKQALEALENYVNVVTSSNDPKDFGGVVDGGEPARQAITALRQAIEQAEDAVLAEREACAKLCENFYRNGNWITKEEAAAAIRARGDVHAIDISQESVDETPKDRHEWAMQKMVEENRRLGLYDDPVATCQENRQVATTDDETPPCKTHPDAPHGFDRNASHSADRYVCECESWEPPKKEWVGLTDEEFEEILRDFSHDPRLLAVEIEVRLTERNI